MRRTQTVSVGDILKEFFERPHVAAKLAEGHLPQYWHEVVGEYGHNNTLELRLERGILHVRVSSAVLRQELLFRRDYIAAELNKRAGRQLVNAIVIR